jgi:hypothetical protein
VARHDSTRFLNIPGVANYLTQDEEASGIIEAESILGPGMFLLVDQAHYGISGDIVEGGQLLAFYNPDTYNSTPEINITGNSVTIVDGDNTPVTGDNTDFGNANTGSPVTKTFVIQNQGPGTLKITDISFFGANKNQFTLVSPPSFPLNVAGNTSQSITVQFLPMVAGVHNATINIVSNDFSESTYDFALKGMGISFPEINMIGNGVTILDGDITPGSVNNTDFGTVLKGQDKTQTFVIQNTGLGILAVSGITFTGTNVGEFTLVSPPTFPLNITTGNNQTISVKFTPTAKGIRTATINIASSDTDEVVYDYALQGNCFEPTSIASNSASQSFAKLYPNPTSDMVTVDMTLTKDEKVVINVLDVNGKLALAGVEKDLHAGEQQMNINTSGLQNGVYFVQVTAGSITTKMKLVVMH